MYKRCPKVRYLVVISKDETSVFKRCPKVRYLVIYQKVDTIVYKRGPKVRYLVMIFESGDSGVQKVLKCPLFINDLKS